MIYRAYILIDPHWTDDQRLRAKESLLMKIAREMDIPIDQVRATATIEIQEQAGEPSYLATFRTDPPATLQWPNEWA